MNPCDFTAAAMFSRLLQNNVSYRKRNSGKEKAHFLNGGMPRALHMLGKNSVTLLSYIPSLEKFSEAALNSLVSYLKTHSGINSDNLTAP
jgi:hypothetical protein